MRGTIAIVTCDDEHGCDEWTVDYHEVGVSNWRELMAGWQFDPFPYGNTKPQMCREHATEAIL